MSDKPNWLKATRTRSGLEVRNVRPCTHYDYAYAGEVLLIDRSWTPFFWKADGIWSREEVGCYSMAAYSLDPASIPTDPEPVCDDDVIDAARQRLVGEKRGAPSEEVLYPMYTPAKPVVKVGPMQGDVPHPLRCVYACKPEFPCSHCDRTTLVSEAPEAPDQREAVQYILKRDAEIFQKLKESEMRDAQKLHGMMAEAEWKPEVGKPAHYCGVEAGECEVTVLAQDEPMYWVAYCHGNPAGPFRERFTASIRELRKPAHKTRDVTVQVWLYVAPDGREQIATVEPINRDYWRSVTGPVSVTFPGVPVDDE